MISQCSIEELQLSMSCMITEIDKPLFGRHDDAPGTVFFSLVVFCCAGIRVGAAHPRQFLARCRTFRVALACSSLHMLPGVLGRIIFQGFSCVFHRNSERAHGSSGLSFGADSKSAAPLSWPPTAQDLGRWDKLMYGNVPPKSGSDLDAGPSYTGGGPRLRKRFISLTGVGVSKITKNCGPSHISNRAIVLITL